MNDFFTNLLARHVGNCDNIKPRTLARFEVDRDSGALVTPDIEDIKRSVPGIDLPKLTDHEADLSGFKKHDLSPSNLESSDPVNHMGLSEQQEDHSDPDILAMNPFEIYPFDEVVRDSLPPALRAAEHDTENELSHRIRAILQRLPGNSELSVTESALDDQASQKYEDQISIPSKKKTPLLDVAVVSLASIPTLERQHNQQNNIFTDGRGENTALYDPLEVPSWLPEIETRFNTHLQDKGDKTEPVINVTIGRVEVRVVQTDTVKKTQRSKKPSGVMPLDDYLKKREERGAR